MSEKAVLNTVNVYLERIMMETSYEKCGSEYLRIYRLAEYASGLIDKLEELDKMSNDENHDISGWYEKYLHNYNQLLDTMYAIYDVILCDAADKSIYQQLNHFAYNVLKYKYHIMKFRDHIQKSHQMFSIITKW